MRLRPLVAVVLLLFPAAVRGDSPGVRAITGGTVHPVAGPLIAGGVVVVRDGLIEAVGSSVTIPADATTIDATGMHVYPGLIDAQAGSTFTLAKEAIEPGADHLATRGLTLSADDDSSRRASGVTTIVTAPSTGIFNGQSVMLNLGEGTVETRVVRSPAALQISFNPRAMWTYPDSLMGVIAFIRQQFLDGQRHIAARETYDRDPAGLQRPPASAALEALRPALRRELPVVFLADSEARMQRALAIAREFQLRPILSGVRQGYRAAEQWRGVPLLVSVRWPVAPANRDDREEQPLRLIRDRQLAPSTPKELAARAIAFALTSGGGKPTDFLPGIRKAIDAGLSTDEALRATTIVPARVFGVDRQLGTLERGKIANVVITDRPIFDAEAKVIRVFVDGREIRVPKEEKKPAAEDAGPIDGTWAIAVRAPQGNVSFQVTLRAENGQLSGTWSGDRGSGELRGGTFADGRFEFTISAPAQNEAETTDWAFAGTVERDSMTGTVTTTLGRFEFSGSRSK